MIEENNTGVLEEILIKLKVKEINFFLYIPTLNQSVRFIKLNCIYFSIEH